MIKSVFFYIALFTIFGCSSGYDSKKVYEEALKVSHPALVSAEQERYSAYAAHFATPGKPESPKKQAALAMLDNLIQGNDRFISNRAAHPNQSVIRRSELAKGQKPEAIVLSCSDSRVPPELVFDKGLGELFVIRSAGEVADAVGLASIEYAVEHLHVKLIVVMGHSSCGAVKAALGTPEGKSAGSPNLDELVRHIRPAVKDMPANDPSLIEPVKSNVRLVTKNLVEHSSILKHAVEHEELLIVQAIYNLESGKVDFWF